MIEDTLREAIASGEELQFLIAGWIVYGVPLRIDERGVVIIIRERGGLLIERWLSTVQRVRRLSELGRSEAAE